MFERLFARRGLSLDRLRVLCAVADAGSIARAAGDEVARQSQFSRQLKELENFFEVELTRRQGKVLMLTDAGRELARVARESIGRLHDFHAHAAEQPVSFSIGAGDSLLHWVVLPRLAGMRTDVNLRLLNLRTTEITNRLHDLSLDFGIVRRDAVSPPLKYAPLGKMEYALFCPKSSAPGKSPPYLDRVVQMVPLAMQTGDGAFMRQFRNWAEANHLDVCIKLECDSFPQACRAVASGRFTAVLPTIARCDLPAEGFWMVDFPALNTKPRQICLAWNPRTIRLRAAASEVADALKHALRV